MTALLSSQRKSASTPRMLQTNRAYQRVSEPCCRYGHSSGVTHIMVFTVVLHGGLGVKSLRPHLERVDDVPLLVPLFTECDARATTVRCVSLFFFPVTD